MTPRATNIVVAACAVVVHLGSLFNGFALDDVSIILHNPLVHSIDGVWRSFTSPYWPAELGGKMYRPLPVATFALDAIFRSTLFFHAVNLFWHAGASVAVAALARRLAGDRVALAAGLLFAVHPVHVEAVANVVGRAELMAALFAMLAVYAALTHRHPAWSIAAFAAGLLSKENAAVVPALVAFAWMLNIERPPRRRMLALAAGWVVVGLVYGAVRWQVLHPFGRTEALAPVFVGTGPVSVRLTAIGALADVLRLLVAPLDLRVEYTPLERTAITTPFDGRFLVGLAVLILWAALLVLAWRRGRRTEALGLGWIAIAFLPVANLLFPTGVLVAERTLYLPSAGLAIAVGALFAKLADRRYALVLATVVVLFAIRSLVRVPVWRDDRSVTLSILADSPDSYRGPARAGSMYQNARQPARALDAYRRSIALYPQDAAVFVAAADAAYTLGHTEVADTMLALANQTCFRCTGMLRVQARAARMRGDSAAADSLVAAARRLEQP